MSKMCRHAAAALLGLVALSWASGQHIGAGSEETITIDKSEAAGIMGFRALWDIPVVLAENGATEVKDKVVTDRGFTAAWAPDRWAAAEPRA